MQSLHGFCQQHDLPKSSVKRWLNSNGFSTSDGLSVQAIAAALGEFKPAPQQQPPGGAIAFHTGNHCSSIELPAYGGMAIDLGQFRDSEALIIDDPLAAAEQFLLAAVALQGALAGDIAAREQRLQATKQAHDQVASKAQQLALEQRLYRMQSAQINQQQSEQSKALADNLAALAALGKPAANDPEQS